MTDGGITLQQVEIMKDDMLNVDKVKGEDQENSFFCHESSFGDGCRSPGDG